MRIGRTSHRPSNPQNAPPAWATPYVTAAAVQEAKDAPIWVVPPGETIGVVAPLATKEVCTLCHARVEELPRALAGAIRKSYPGDQATGFSAGEVRGWMRLEPGA